MEKEFSAALHPTQYGNHIKDGRHRATHKNPEIQKLMDAGMSELKVFYSPDGEYTKSYYLKSEADKVIAAKNKEITELKERVREERSAKVDYKISARDLSNGLKEAQVEIRRYVKMVKQLKANLDRQEGANRRLKRALYKACANWADVEVFDRTVGIDDPNVEANRWALMRNKCLKKAEEYRWQR